MEKEPDGLRLLQEQHVIQEEGWIKLSPLLMKSLGIGEGDMISFIADEKGFRVKGGKKPPYFGSPAASMMMKRWRNCVKTESNSRSHS